MNNDYLPERRYSVGTNVHCITSSDFDRDGVLDVATANINNSTVSLLLGKVGGTFELPSSDSIFATGASPRWITHADLNKDGYPDLITANRASPPDGVSVFINVGDDSTSSRRFREAVHYPTGSGSVSVVSGDFNRDGLVDLATANIFSDNVSVLLGIGNGEFATAQNYDAGDGSSSITTGDFNGDGFLDLATANEYASSISILAGLGTGSFQPAENFVTASRAFFITTADLNADGQLDLATTNYYSSNVHVHLGKGDGSFSSVQAFLSGSGPSSITTADFNFDGIVDLAAVNSGDNNFSILSGRGDGTFHLSKLIPTGAIPASIVSQDFDRNGVPDFVVGNYDSCDLSVFLQQPGGSVNLSGITAGLGESQPLRVTASSSNTALIPTPSVDYSSPNTTGTLYFTPVANQAGTTTFIVTVEDGGLDGDLNTPGDNARFSRAFQVIVNSTKFFVVNDGSPDKTFEYSATGTSIENYSIASGNTAPRGIVSNVAGSRIWVVDRNRNIYVYNNSGGLLETWMAGTLNSKSTLEGIATDGTHIWVVDSTSDRIYFYANAANPGKSGTLSASKNYALNTGNKNPKDIVFGTDGVNRFLWVVDDAKTDKVFCYRLDSTNETITPVNSWNLNAGNKTPTGITLDPGATSGDLWVVDNGATKQVFRYANGRTSPSPIGSSVFILSSSNSNPQGIADPPPQPPADLAFAELSRKNDLSARSFSLDLEKSVQDGLPFGLEKRMTIQYGSQTEAYQAKNHRVDRDDSNGVQPILGARTNLSVKPRFWEQGSRREPKPSRLNLADFVGCLLAEVSGDWS